MRVGAKRRMLCGLALIVAAPAFSFLAAGNASAAGESTKLAPVDVVVTPLVDLKIPLLGSVIKGSTSALQAIDLLHPQVILPTAAGGDVILEGLLMSILQTSGGVEEFRQLLSAKQSPTQVIDPKPGDRFLLEFTPVS